MAITDQLGQLSVDALVSGENTLHRAFIHGSAISTDVTPVNLLAVKNVESDAISYERTTKFLQEGGGYDPLERNVGPSHMVRITVYAGQLPTFLASLMGVSTFGVSGYAAQTLAFDSLARFDLESVYRAANNVDHVFTILHQDLIIQPFAVNSPMEEAEVIITAKTYHDPVLISTGAECVYSQFATDGSETSFTLPYTPLSLRDLTVGNADDWVLEKMIYVKTKLDTASQGTRQKSGVSLSGSDLVFGTAPAADGRVQCLGVRATS